MNTKSLLETNSSRIQEVNKIAAGVGAKVQLLAIQTVLQRAVFADQESEQIGEVHLMDIGGGIRRCVDVWFRSGRVCMIGNPRAPHALEFATI